MRDVALAPSGEIFCMSQAVPNRRELTAQYFGRLAGTYGSGEYYRKRREAVVAEVRQTLAGAASLLDLGCGNGAYLVEFRKSFAKTLVAGADYSPDMLREAQRRCQGDRSPPLVRCDAGVLAFRSHRWAAIFCSHVLQLVDDLPQCLTEIARCLAPDGLLIVAGGAVGARRNMAEALGSEHWSKLEELFPRAASGRRRRDPDEYRKACEGVGLTVESKAVGFNVTLADLAEWYRVRWLPVIAEPARREAERILADAIGARGADKLELSETLLFAHQTN